MRLSFAASAVSLACTLAAACAPAVAPVVDGGPCAAFVLDVVVRDGAVDLYPRPRDPTDDCECTQSFTPLDQCTQRGTDYRTCGCVGGDGARPWAYVPALAAARLVAGDVVVPFDVSGDALRGGMTWAESAGADPSIDDDVDLSLDGCFGAVRVPLSAAPFAPPTLVETTTAEGVDVDVVAPAGADHLLECPDRDIVSTCCPLPLAGAVIHVRAVDEVRGYVRAVRAEGEYETAAGTVRVWRETGARTTCCEAPP